MLTTGTAANWFARFANISYQILAVQSPFPNFVRLSLQAPGPNHGPNVVSYSPPPFDVVEQAPPNTPVVAFTDFPLGGP